MPIPLILAGLVAGAAVIGGGIAIVATQADDVLDPTPDKGIFGTLGVNPTTLIIGVSGLAAYYMYLRMKGHK